MTLITQAVPRDRFLRLLPPDTAKGAARRVGVEIEFAGLEEQAIAELVRARWGGEVVMTEPYELEVRGTRHGTVRAFLDTAFRKKHEQALVELGLEFGRDVIPVELATDPLRPDELPALEALREEMRRAGALGSRTGLLLGFGLHLNVEVAAERMDAVRPVLTAFALVEDWLRHADPIDGSRRLMPFVDPYPRSFVRALIELAPGAGFSELIDLYLRLTPTRNRALDMLPLFKHLDPERLEGATWNRATVKGRPTYHYRLPDSRVDEPDWRLAYEWNRWVLVERVASDGGLLEALQNGWRAADAERAPRHEWCLRAEALIAEADILRGTA